MSSFPEDTQEETGLVGEGGVQDAGGRVSTSILDRLKPRLEMASRMPASPAAVQA
jgi:hypothetical protein